MCQSPKVEAPAYYLTYVSSAEVRVLCQGGSGPGGGHAHAQSDVTSAWSGHIGTQKKFLSPLIGQEFKMTKGKQPCDWTIIQDGRWACDWTRSQDGGGKSSHLIGQEFKMTDGPVIGQKFKMADGTGSG